MITEIIDKTCAIVPLDNPSPIAFMNIYEKGDIWVKIKGCEDCPLESRKKCCGNCPMFTEKGCFFHLGSEIKRSNKPFHCAVRPSPNSCASYCYLEFKCIKGSKKGKIRKVSKPGNIFD